MLLCRILLTLSTVKLLLESISAAEVKTRPGQNQLIVYSQVDISKEPKGLRSLVGSQALKCFPARPESHPKGLQQLCPAWCWLCQKGVLHLVPRPKLCWINQSWPWAAPEVWRWTFKACWGSWLTILEIKILELVGKQGQNGYKMSFSSVIVLCWGWNLGWMEQLKAWEGFSFTFWPIHVPEVWLIRNLLVFWVTLKFNFNPD